MASGVGEKPRGEKCRGVHGSELLELAARKILAWGPPFGGAYLYAIEVDRLRLVAFAGPSTDEVEIAIDSGGLQPGTAALTRLIRRHDLVLGAIVAAPSHDGSFSDDHARDVTQVAHALAALL